jgi:hypothetical protein
MGAWIAALGKERSDKELAEIRYEVATEWDIQEFSCDACGARRTCPFVFDAYNTNGDCLAEK